MVFTYHSRAEQASMTSYNPLTETAKASLARSRCERLGARTLYDGPDHLMAQAIAGNSQEASFQLEEMTTLAQESMPEQDSNITDLVTHSLTSLISYLLK